MAAVLLLCAAFLPLSQCSYSKTPAPTLQALFPRSDSEVQYNYAVTWVNFSTSGALTLLAFTWPLLFVGLFRRSGKSRTGWLATAPELLLCAGTLYWIYVMTAFRDRLLYGTYVAVLAVLLYASGVLLPAVQAVRAFYSRRRTIAVPAG